MAPSRFQDPYFELACAPQHALITCFGAQGDKVTRLVYQKQIIKVARKGQPKHFNAGPAPKQSAVATHVSGSKWVQSTRLDIVNGSLLNLCVGSSAGVTYLCYTVLTSFEKDKTAVHRCDSCHVWCLETSFT